MCAYACACVCTHPPPPSSQWQLNGGEWSIPSTLSIPDAVVTALNVRVKSANAQPKKRAKRVSVHADAEGSLSRKGTRGGGSRAPTRTSTSSRDSGGSAGGGDGGGGGSGGEELGGSVSGGGVKGFGSESVLSNWEEKYVTSFTMRKLRARGRYRVRVAAVNKAGAGEFVETGEVVLPDRVQFLLDAHGDKLK